MFEFLNRWNNTLQNSLESAALDKELMTATAWAAPGVQGVTA